MTNVPVHRESKHSGYDGIPLPPSSLSWLTARFPHHLSTSKCYNMKPPQVTTAQEYQLPMYCWIQISGIQCYNMYLNSGVGL